MGILCSVGLHRPGGEQWNKGWYFASCERCGSDLVRTGSGRWHVPKGSKVVWRQKTPRGRRPGAEGSADKP